MIAIIPARKGSKGVPDKNIRNLAGRPLIEWTIKAAIKSSNIERVIVSTDSEQIADVAVKAGAEVPFLRPNHLATDNASAIDVYIYTCDKLMHNENILLNSFVILQPTSPLRIAEDIDNAIKIFLKNNAESVISVTQLPHPVEWINKVSADGILIPVYPDFSLKNRQVYYDYYIPNGAVYVLSYGLLKTKRNYYFQRTYPYIMPAERSIDIDTIFDFDYAEFIMRNNNLS